MSLEIQSRYKGLISNDKYLCVVLSIGNKPITIHSIDFIDEKGRVLSAPSFFENIVELTSVPRNRRIQFMVQATIINEPVKFRARVNFNGDKFADSRELDVRMLRNVWGIFGAGARAT